MSISGKCQIEFPYRNARNQGKIVRNIDTGVAIKFAELDLDSFIHLRNIVSRNTLDEKIIKEFQNYRAGEAFKR